MVRTSSRSAPVTHGVQTKGMSHQKARGALNIISPWAKLTTRIVPKMAKGQSTISP